MFEKINVAKILPLKRKSRIFITWAEIVCKPLILQSTYKLLNRNHLLAALTGTCFKKQLLWKIFFQKFITNVKMTDFILRRYYHQTFHSWDNQYLLTKLFPE